MTKSLEMTKITGKCQKSAKIQKIRKNAKSQQNSQKGNKNICLKSAKMAKYQQKVEFQFRMS